MASDIERCWVCHHGPADSRRVGAEPLLHNTCLCRGSLGTVHESCLVQWIQRSASDSGADDGDGVDEPNDDSTAALNRSCKSCGHAYKFEAIFKPGAPRNPADVNVVYAFVFILYVWVTVMFAQTVRFTVALALRHILVPMVAGCIALCWIPKITGDQLWLRQWSTRDMFQFHQTFDWLDWCELVCCGAACTFGVRLQQSGWAAWRRMFPVMRDGEEKRPPAAGVNGTVADDGAGNAGGNTTGNSADTAVVQDNNAHRSDSSSNDDEEEEEEVDRGEDAYLRPSHAYLAGLDSITEYLALDAPLFSQLTTAVLELSLVTAGGFVYYNLRLPGIVAILLTFGAVQRLWFHDVWVLIKKVESLERYSTMLKLKKTAPRSKVYTSYLTFALEVCMFSGLLVTLMGCSVQLAVRCAFDLHAGRIDVPTLLSGQLFYEQFSFLIDVNTPRFITLFGLWFTGVLCTIANLRFEGGAIVSVLAHGVDLFFFRATDYLNNDDPKLESHENLLCQVLDCDVLRIFKDFLRCCLYELPGLFVMAFAPLYVSLSSISYFDHRAGHPSPTTVQNSDAIGAGSSADTADMFSLNFNLTELVDAVQRELGDINGLWLWGNELVTDGLFVLDALFMVPDMIFGMFYLPVQLLAALGFSFSSFRGTLDFSFDLAIVHYVIAGCIVTHALIGVFFIPPRKQLVRLLYYTMRLMGWMLGCDKYLFDDQQVNALALYFDSTDEALGVVTQHVEARLVFVRREHFLAEEDRPRHLVKKRVIMGTVLFAVVATYVTFFMTFSFVLGYRFGPVDMLCGPISAPENITAYQFVLCSCVGCTVLSLFIGLLEYSVAFVRLQLWDPAVYIGSIALLAVVATLMCCLYVFAAAFSMMYALVSSNDVAQQYYQLLYVERFQIVPWDEEELRRAATGSPPTDPEVIQDDQSAVEADSGADETHDWEVPGDE